MRLPPISEYLKCDSVVTSKSSESPGTLLAAIMHMLIEAAAQIREVCVTIPKCVLRMGACISVKPQSAFVCKSCL